MAGLALHPRLPGALHHRRQPGRLGARDPLLRLRRGARRPRRDVEKRGRARRHRDRVRRRALLLSARRAAAGADVEDAVIATALTDLWYGFGVALEPQNLAWCFLGVLVGNMVGVLPGMGPPATISMLLPLTFGIKPVGAILMLAGVMYGAQYGGAICSILLNLPCHPPHAVTCLDGYPM